MARLVITRQARDDLAQLADSLRRAVSHSLDELEVDPRVGKPLLGRLAGLWSLRVGSYRILYSVEGRIVVVRAVRHRAVAYSRGRR